MMDLRDWENYEAISYSKIDVWVIGKGAYGIFGFQYLFGLGVT